eukprot:355015-Chlamydomonas_euryale.AAC.3
MLASSLHVFQPLDESSNLQEDIPAALPTCAQCGPLGSCRGLVLAPSCSSSHLIINQLGFLAVGPSCSALQRSVKASRSPPAAPPAPGTPSWAPSTRPLPAACPSSGTRPSMVWRRWPR